MAMPFSLPAYSFTIIATISFLSCAITGIVFKKRLNTNGSYWFFFTFGTFWCVITTLAFLALKHVSFDFLLTLHTIPILYNWYFTLTTAFVTLFIGLRIFPDEPLVKLNDGMIFTMGCGFLFCLLIWAGLHAISRLMDGLPVILKLGGFYVLYSPLVLMVLSLFFRQVRRIFLYYDCVLDRIINGVILYTPLWRFIGGDHRKYIFKYYEKSAYIQKKLSIRDHSPSMRIKAAALLNAQNVFLKQAVKDKNSKVRKAAVIQLDGNQEVIKKIARGDKDTDVRCVALEKIEDENFLFDVAFHGEDREMRTTAAKGLKNQALIQQVALSSKDAGVRKLAVERIEDQGLLRQISLEDNDQSVRAKAIQKIKAYKALSEIYAAHPADFEKDALKANLRLCPKCGGKIVHDTEIDYGGPGLSSSYDAHCYNPVISEKTTQMNTCSKCRTVWYRSFHSRVC